MTDTTPTEQGIQRLRSSVEALRQEIAAARTEPITSMRSPQLDTFWAAAQEVADDDDMCDVYDRIAREMGGRSREDHYLVEVDVTLTTRVWVQSTGRDAAEARRKVNEEMSDSHIADVIRDAEHSTEPRVIEHRTTGDVREDS